MINVRNAIDSYMYQMHGDTKKQNNSFLMCKSLHPFFEIIECQNIRDKWAIFSVSIAFSDWKICSNVDQGLCFRTDTDLL